jgi:enoyl-CoA hydratase/carnithine racemase
MFGRDALTAGLCPLSSPPIETEDDAVSDDNEVLYDVKDRIATVTLNRPDRMNSVNDTLPGNIAKAMVKAATDPGVRAIILTGAGRAFCAGADIERLQKSSTTSGTRPPPPADDPSVLPAIASGFGPDLGPQFADIRRYSYFMRIGKPVIAALNGATAGLGFVMALCADMRFATDKMVFTTAFAQRGLIAEHGIAWLLPRLVGPSNAIDLLMSARRVSSQEAKEMGLVNKIFPQETFMQSVRDYARILTDTVSPHSVAVVKAQVWKSMHESYIENLVESDRQLVMNHSFPDRKEGVAHFVEKRPANFPNLPKAG